jgi:poly-gamma-glutamate synthesis protein (capsule biosynthesis protein)
MTPEQNPFRLLDDAHARGSRDLVLVAVGDVSQATTQWPEETDRLGEKVFDPTRHLSLSGDLAFMNLENPVTTSKPTAEKKFAFAADPGRLDWYFGAGYNLYGLANNHIADAGQPAIEATIEHLESSARRHQRAVYYAGAGSSPTRAIEPRFVRPEGKDVTLAFFSVGFSASENVADFRDASLGERIERARALADIVIVSSHAGEEYEHVPEYGLISMYRRWIERGADIVLSHHPHCVRPVEAYQHGLIYYSLGNFVFMSRTHRHRKRGAKLYGMMTRIIIEHGQLHGAEIIPVWVNNSEDWKPESGEVMPNANFVPNVLNGAFAARFFEDLNRWAARVGIAPLVPDGDVAHLTVRRQSRRLMKELR